MGAHEGDPDAHPGQQDSEELRRQQAHLNFAASHQARHAARQENSSRCDPGFKFFEIGDSLNESCLRCIAPGVNRITAAVLPWWALGGGSEVDDCLETYTAIALFILRYVSLPTTINKWQSLARLPFAIFKLLDFRGCRRLRVRHDDPIIRAPRLGPVTA